MGDQLEKITILVADDEALARKRIVKFLTKSNYEIRILESSSGKESIETIRTQKPKLVFLDIKMTDMTGFDVIDSISKKEIPIIIFVTAFDTFAIKAFELKAIDFLLKPYKEDRFNEALDRGMKQVELENNKYFQSNILDLIEYIKLGQDESKSTGNYLNRITLKLNRKYYFIKTEEIVYIKASGYYAEIFSLNGRKHIYRISMTELALQLDPDHFLRINRSTIISLDQIHELLSEGMGDFSVVMKDGNSFGITQNYKLASLRKLGVK